MNLQSPLLFISKKNTMLLFVISIFFLGIDIQTQNTDMIHVKSGWFIMGCDSGSYDEQPTHKVFVSDFFMDKFEITNQQDCDFLNTIGNQIENGK